jgi:1-acyl-sn-glycerol-3-phosphate acyltransferase
VPLRDRYQWRLAGPTATLRCVASNLNPPKSDLPADAGVVASALFWLWVLVVGAVCQLLSLVVAIGGGLVWDKDRRVFHGINRLWGRTLCRTLPMSIEFRGPGTIGGGPFIIAPNHQSVVDLLVLYRLEFEYRTIIKRSWFRTPFGFAIWSAGYVPTARSGDPQQATRTLETCQHWLRRGVSLLIFPEGRRSDSARISRFKRGAFELAVATGVPVLPVVIAGGHELIARRAWRFRSVAPIIVEVLAPIEAGDDARALRDRCRELITDRYATLHIETRDRMHQSGA